MYFRRTIFLLLLTTSLSISIFVAQELPIDDILLKCFEGTKIYKKLKKQSFDLSLLAYDDFDIRSRGGLGLYNFLSEKNIAPKIFCYACYVACSCGSRDLLRFFIESLFVEIDNLNKEKLFSYARQYGCNNELISFLKDLYGFMHNYDNEYVELKKPQQNKRKKRSCVIL